MLPQKSSARLSKKYILFSSRDAKKIKATLIDYLGILGWAKASPIFVEDNILAVSNKSLDDIRASLELSKANIRILRVSGTLKGLGKL